MLKIIDALIFWILTGKSPERVQWERHQAEQAAWEAEHYRKVKEDKQYHAQWMRYFEVPTNTPSSTYKNYARKYHPDKWVGTGVEGELTLLMQEANNYRNDPEALARLEHQAERICGR